MKFSSLAAAVARLGGGAKLRTMPPERRGVRHFSESWSEGSHACHIRTDMELSICILARIEACAKIRIGERRLDITATR